MAPHAPMTGRDTTPSSALYHREDFRRRLWSLSDGVHSFHLPFGVGQRRFLKTWLFLILGALALAFGVVFALLPSPAYWKNDVTAVWFWGLFILTASPVLGEALFNVRQGKFASEALFLTIVAFGGAVLGLVAESIFVLLLFRFMEILLTGSLGVAKDRIQVLFSAKPRSGRVTRGGQEIELPIHMIERGEVLRVCARETVPLDGTLESDSALFLRDVFTGEGASKEIKKGEKVLAGWQLLTSEIQVTATTIEKETVLHSLFTYLERSLATKSRRAHRLTLALIIYTVLAVLFSLSLLILPLFWETNYNWQLWFSRSLSVLVLAMPASLATLWQVQGFSTLSRAVSQGIFFRNLDVLEKLSNVKMVFTDLTNTMTTGRFTVKEGRSEKGGFNEFYGKVSALERHSQHPIAQSIVREDETDYADSAIVAHVEEVAGEGIKGLVNGTLVMVGNERFMERYRILYHDRSDFRDNPCLLVAFDGEFAGYIMLEDHLRADAEKFITNLKEKEGVKKVILLSRERESIVKRMSFWLGIATAKSGLNDKEKTEQVRIQRRWIDGNTLALSHSLQAGRWEGEAGVKVAMDAFANPEVLDQSDVVIFSTELDKVRESIALARENRRTLRVRMVGSFAMKILFWGAGAFSLLTFWQVYFSDSLLSLLALTQVLVVHKVRLSPAIKKPALPSLKK